MTRLLKKVMERIFALPEDEQDAIAGIILEELEDERRWQETFARTQVGLARLAKAAREEIEKDRVFPYDPASKPD